VSALPVVNHFGQVVGIVSETDLLHKIQAVDDRRSIFQGSARRRDRAKARGRTARDLMTAGVVTILPSIAVPVAAERMLAAGVRRLPVEDDLGRLVGIVTRSDLLKARQVEPARA
jgi:CBS domain-containing protein